MSRKLDVVTLTGDEYDTMREAIEDAAEAAEILDNLIDSVAKHGNYSQEATITFLQHARQCLNGVTPNAIGQGDGQA